MKLLTQCDTVFVWSLSKSRSQPTQLRAQDLIPFKSKKRKRWLPRGFIVKNRIMPSV